MLASIMCSKLSCKHASEMSDMIAISIASQQTSMQAGNTVGSLADL
jgi:hypothetical protein